MIRAGVLTGNVGYYRAGVANYVHHLTMRLSRLTPVTTISHHSGKRYPGTETIFPLYPPIRFNTILWSAAVSLSAKQYQHLDLVHNPSQYPLPWPCHNRYLVTVHDLTAYTMPEYHTRYRTWYTRCLVLPHLRSATHLIADSACTKQELQVHLNIPSEQITVVHLAAEERFRPCTEEEKGRIKEKYQLHLPYILFVGTIEPRKNIPALLEAFKYIHSKNKEIQLVIAGQNGWKFQEVYERCRRLNLSGSVQFLSYIPHEDLPALYSAAELFVFPSWYEGFGLPPLEAMQCGCPVIVSDRGSLPEIVGPGGCIVPPDDIEVMSETIERFLADEQLRNEQIRYSLNRATLFSWDKTAEETMQIYKRLLE